MTANTVTPFLQRLSEVRPFIYADAEGIVNLEWITGDWRLLISLETDGEPFWVLVARQAAAQGRARVEGERPLKPLEVVD